MTTVTDQLLTTREATTQLRISRTTLWRLTCQGHFTPLRITPRRTVYRQAEIDQFLNHGQDLIDDIRTALQLVNEKAAEQRNPLCPNCGTRRVSRGHDHCLWCEQQAEAQRLHKRTWWEKTGSAARSQQRQQAHR